MRTLNASCFCFVVFLLHAKIFRLRDETTSKFVISKNRNPKLCDFQFSVRLAFYEISDFRDYVLPITSRVLPITKTKLFLLETSFAISFNQFRSKINLIWLAKGTFYNQKQIRHVSVDHRLARLYTNFIFEHFCDNETHRHTCQHGPTFYCNKFVQLDKCFLKTNIQ